MNWVPLLFIDAVCHQLTKPTFLQVSQLSGSWPSIGAEHRKKRRELKFRCELNGNQKVSYNLWEIYSHNLTVADLNLEFDRIISFACDSALLNDHRVSLREFEEDVLPTIAYLITNCCWPHVSPKRSAQNRIFFNAFKNCPGFNDITVKEQGEESRDFVARQVELGNVQRLYLSGTVKWPEAENLAETLKIFVSSARFHSLISRHPLRAHYKLFELFLERAPAKKLKRGAYIDTAAGNFDKNRLLALHPDCRHDSEKDAWRISDSNLRIALRHDSSMLELEVEADELMVRLVNCGEPIRFSFPFASSKVK